MTSQDRVTTTSLDLQVLEVSLAALLREGNLRQEETQRIQNIAE